MFTSIFNLVAMLDPVVAPSNRNSISCWLWDSFLRSSINLICYSCCPWQQVIPLSLISFNLIYNLYVISLVTIVFSIVCCGRSQIASYLFLIYTVAKQLIIVHKFKSGGMGLEISVFSCEGMVVVSWLASVDSLLMICQLCF